MSTMFRTEIWEAEVTTPPGSSAIWASMGNYVATVYTPRGAIASVTIGRPSTGPIWGNASTLTYRPLPTGTRFLGIAHFAADSDVPTAVFWHFHEAPMYGEC
jgi:hypothetical protein